jgi:hypothetical protein
MSVDDVAAHIKRIEEDPNFAQRTLGDWTDKVADLKSAFQDMVNTYRTDAAKTKGLPTAQARIVILIDDLDRCMPDTAVHLLEKIKHFLAVDGCVFVLGINPQVIERGIKIKYRGLDVDGREYLEKILNHSFYLPEPELSSVRKFAANELLGLIVDQAERNKHEQTAYVFGGVLQDCRFANPRKIKRILNRFLLFLNRFEQDLLRYDIPTVVRLLILAEYFPDLFQLCLAGPEQRKRLRKIDEPDFRVDTFEADMGVSLGDRRLELSRLRGLFKFHEALPNEPTFDFSHIANDVYSLTAIR